MRENLPVLNVDKLIFNRSMKTFDLENFLNDLQKQLQNIAMSKLTTAFLMTLLVSRIVAHFWKNSQQSCTFVSNVEKRKAFKSKTLD